MRIEDEIHLRSKLDTPEQPLWQDMAHAIARKSFYETVYFLLAARAGAGDLSCVEEELTGLADTSGEQRYLDRFRNRFVEFTDGFDPDGIEDDLLRTVALAYEKYWRDTLMQPTQRRTHEDRLASQAASLLHTFEGIADAGDTNARLNAAIKTRGFGALIGGRTGPLLELMAWRSEEIKSFDVELTDCSESVVVHFIDDFISRGWQDYATFGVSQTEGWTSRDAVYVIGNERDSEHFRVSCLQHEARHVADLKRYPNLWSADLEYRAKLTELAFADADPAMLLRSFSETASPSTTDGHSLASWHVANDVSRALFGRWPKYQESWEEIDAERVRDLARSLLANHTQALERAGSASVNRIIRPQS